eukprot:CAMPEP_0115191636 /NCGR_PEP_ID=MMETSP0270-20121206/12632_1 /TAXON_ID=71861 /ORGANISM="Scrippsiella trochoidea, Strain CCMP3099" /LENGTH=294 /DNA_ID=CAMNT_0002604863 /DNA_START=3 /DNA_END=887 /DNA_ORIENTATION=+
MAGGSMQQSVEAGRAGASELELPEHKSPEAKCESRSHGASEDALRMHLAPTHRRVLLRLPAILITFSIEMVVAFVISRYEETLVKYPLLISFQPVVSAVSGNVGLQSSSIVIRNLALGLNSERKMRQAMRPEIKAGFLMASIMGVVVGLTAFIWYSPWLAAAHTWRGSASFAFTVCLGVFFSMVAAAISGSAAPLLTKRCGFDPSAMGGPMETAFQDAVGLLSRMPSAAPCWSLSRARSSVPWATRGSSAREGMQTGASSSVASPHSMGRLRFSIRSASTVASVPLQLVCVDCK